MPRPMPKNDVAMWLKSNQLKCLLLESSIAKVVVVVVRESSIA